MDWLQERYEEEREKREKEEREMRYKKQREELEKRQEEEKRYKEVLVSQGLGFDCNQIVGKLVVYIFRDI
jgi:serine protease inhibitor ecotin